MQNIYCSYSISSTRENIDKCSSFIGIDATIIWNCPDNNEAIGHYFKKHESSWIYTTSNRKIQGLKQPISDLLEVIWPKREKIAEFQELFNTENILQVHVQYDDGESPFVGFCEEHIKKFAELSCSIELDIES